MTTRGPDDFMPITVQSRSMATGAWDVRVDLDVLGLTLTPRTARALGRALIACADAADAATFAVRYPGRPDDAERGRG